MPVEISGVNVHLTSVQFASPNTLGAFLYINHDETGKTYEIFKKTDLDANFVSLGTTTSFDNFFLLEDGITCIQYRIVCTDDNSIDYETDVIIIPTDEFFVTIEGRYLQQENGIPMGGSKILYDLEPKVLDLEIGGSVISWNIDGYIRTDEDGFFSVRLPANKGSDGSKIISYPNTYYVFRFDDKSYLREINLDDGAVQQFSNLLRPEKKRVREDVYYDLRHS